MNNIPAASIHDVDLAEIRLRFPGVADEIARLGSLLARGQESQDDIILLAKLLKTVGKSEKAEELLRQNVVDENDLVHRAHVDLFGRRTRDEFERAISEFAEQFGVKLSETGPPRFLKSTYLSRPSSRQEIPDARIAALLRGPAEIEFKYESDGTRADISSDLPELSDKFVILRHTNTGWEYFGGSTE
jgi:hypothetical protein